MNRVWNVGSSCHASNIATYNSCHIRNKWEKFKDIWAVKAFLRRMDKRESKGTPLTTRRCHISQFLTKDETGLEAPNPLTLRYQRDLNLRLRISCSYARSCADHLRAFSNYFWVWRTRLVGEDGRPTCALHVPATEVYDDAAAKWQTRSWVLKTFA